MPAFLCIFYYIIGSRKYQFIFEHLFTLLIFNLTLDFLLKKWYYNTRLRDNN